MTATKDQSHSTAHYRISRVLPLQYTFFLFQIKYYEQVDGVVMGSLVCPIIAHISMMQFGGVALKTAYVVEKVCKWHVCNTVHRTQTELPIPHEQYRPSN